MLSQAVITARAKNTYKRRNYYAEIRRRNCYVRLFTIDISYDKCEIKMILNIGLIYVEKD